MEGETALEELDCFFEEGDEGARVAAYVVERFGEGGEDLGCVAGFC